MTLHAVPPLRINGKEEGEKKKNDSSLDSRSVLLWKINLYTQGREEEGKDRRVATERHETNGRTGKSSRVL